MMAIIVLIQNAIYTKGDKKALASASLHRFHIEIAQKKRHLRTRFLCFPLCQAALQNSDIKCANCDLDDDIFTRAASAGG